MRLFRICTFALLATAIRADIIRCTANVCTDGVITITGGGDGFVLEPLAGNFPFNAGGVTLVNRSAPSTLLPIGFTFSIEITVPYTWAINPSDGRVQELANIPPNTGTGVAGSAYDYLPDGTRSGGSLDTGNYGIFDAAGCQLCGFGSNYDFGGVGPPFGPVSRVAISEFIILGPIDVREMQFQFPFSATAPEPATLLLLATALALGALRFKKRGAQLFCRTNQVVRPA